MFEKLEAFVVRSCAHKPALRPPVGANANCSGCLPIGLHLGTFGVTPSPFERAKRVLRVLAQGEVGLSKDVQSAISWTSSMSRRLRQRRPSTARLPAT